MTVNEQVCCLMDEHSNRGVILGAVYSKKTMPDLDGGLIGVKFSDGTQVYFNPQDGSLLVNTHGDVTIEPGAKVTINGDLSVTGTIKAGDQITAYSDTPAQVNLSTHIHSTPAGPSSAPTPGT